MDDFEAISPFQICPSVSKSREQTKSTLLLACRAPPNQSQLEAPNLRLPSRPDKQSNRNRRLDRVRLAGHPYDLVLVIPHVQPGIELQLILDFPFPSLLYTPPRTTSRRSRTPLRDLFLKQIPSTTSDPYSSIVIVFVLTRSPFAIRMLAQSRQVVNCDKVVSLLSELAGVSCNKECDKDNVEGEIFSMLRAI